MGRWHAGCERPIDRVERGFGAFLGTPAEDVIRFTVGQPDAATPLTVVRAAVEALEAGQTAYTDPAGTVAVRQSVATYLSDRHNIPVTGEEVVITPGCKQAVLYGIMASASAGDEILIIAPAWPTYEAQCKMLGIHPVQVPATTDYRPDLDALEALISDRTKAIMINSPNNPTGAVYSKDEVRAIVDLAERHDLWILDDMIYADLAWTEAGYISPASVGGAHRTITIGGWSKAWSMTGWRMGWIAGPPGDRHGGDDLADLLRHPHCDLPDARRRRRLQLHGGGGSDASHLPRTPCGDASWCGGPSRRHCAHARGCLLHPR